MKKEISKIDLYFIALFFIQIYLYVGLFSEINVNLGAIISTNSNLALIESVAYGFILFLLFRNFLNLYLVYSLQDLTLQEKKIKSVIKWTIILLIISTIVPIFIAKIIGSSPLGF